MISSKKKETVQHERGNCRILPVAPIEKTRSRSLPKIRDKKILKEQLEARKFGDLKLSQSLSHSVHTFFKPEVNQSIEEETVEVPVVIDEVTKWITGVNKHTTCQDIIKAILETETETFQVMKNTEDSKNK